ncbi:MAG: hypothetical protein KF857_12620 [Fimbriimonadaceae bacterium]|nr:hypothetical protein [Fimbriimonadaceae bacterium]
MRVRNKELRNRRRRKEKRVKDLIKEAIAETKSGGKAKVAKPAAKKAEAAEKPKRAAKPKKDAAE